MKTQISFLEIKYLVDEFKELIGSKVDSITNSDENEISIQFFISGQGKKILRILPNFIYLATTKKLQEKLSGFCMNLRKNLINSRLRKIIQFDSERVIEFFFETKKEKFILIAELFSKGNIILCNEDYTILSVLESQKWKDRELKVKLKYHFPPQKLNFFKLEKEKLSKLFDNDKPFVKKLASDLGLGSVYAEEICLLSGIDKEKIRLDKDDIKKIIYAIDNIIKNKTDACIVYDKEKIKDIVPFHLMHYDGYKTKDFDNYNSALDFFLSNNLLVSNENKKFEVYSKKIDKVEKIIRKQEEKIKEIESSIDENEKKASAIYNNYALVKEINEEIQKALKKYSWEEIKQKLKDHKIIKEVNSKDKKIILEID
jgi:predicted ribosome quality control (RQC) complex YloA/Tae2 family protein